MTAFELNFLGLVVYRLALFVVGLALAYMSYRLFLSGFFESAGELKAAWGEKRLAWKQAAPGTVFAILAAAVVVWSLCSGPPSVPSNTTATGLTKQVPDSIMEIVLKSVCQARLSQAEHQRFTTWYAAQWRRSCP